MHYQIFIPGVETPNPDHLDAVGLGDLRAGASFSHCGEGPGGLSGQLVSWGFGAEYDAGWRWQPIKQCGELPAGRFWIGVDPEQPPTPDDLRRPDFVYGTDVELADGQKWMIPAARQLPTIWTLRESDGAPIKKTRAKYSGYFERARELFAKFESLYNADEHRTPLKNQELVLGGEWDLACEALAMNYRVNPVVVDFLELLDHYSVLHIVGHSFEVFDLAAIVFQKKTADIALCRAMEIIWRGEVA